MQNEIVEEQKVDARSRKQDAQQRTSVQGHTCKIQVQCLTVHYKIYTAAK